MFDAAKELNSLEVPPGKNLVALCLNSEPPQYFLY
jgi:hypothetical protein